MKNITAFLLLLSLTSTANGASVLSTDQMSEISELLSNNSEVARTFDKLNKKNYQFMGIVENTKVSYCEASELKLLFSKWSQSGVAEKRKDHVVKVEYANCNGSPMIHLIEG